MSGKNPFIGLGTALVTPFRKDGSVDYDTYIKLVRRQVEAGVDFLVPLATTGETPCLNAEERLRLLDLTREHAGGRPLLVGCGTNSLEGTLAAMKAVEDRGADGFLVVVPYYNKPTQAGLKAYYAALAAATDKPIVIYNVPGRTGANILPDTVLDLARTYPNIAGVKEASGSYAQMATLAAGAPEGFALLSGDDEMTLALMASGGKGVISVASNAFPKEMADFVHALLRDGLPAARAIFFRLLPVFRACFLESNPVPVKAMMARMGLMEDVLRLPLVSASAATQEKIGAVLKEFCKF